MCENVSLQFSAAVESHHRATVSRWLQLLKPGWNDSRRVSSNFHVTSCRILRLTTFVHLIPRWIRHNTGVQEDEHPTIHCVFTARRYASAAAGSNSILVLFVVDLQTVVQQSHNKSNRWSLGHWSHGPVSRRYCVKTAEPIQLIFGSGAFLAYPVLRAKEIRLFSKIRVLLCGIFLPTLDFDKFCTARLSSSSAINKRLWSVCCWQHNVMSTVDVAKYCQLFDRQSSFVYHTYFASSSGWLWRDVQPSAKLRGFLSPNEMTLITMAHKTLFVYPKIKYIFRCALKWVNSSAAITCIRIVSHVALSQHLLVLLDFIAAYIIFLHVRIRLNRSICAQFVAKAAMIVSGLKW